MFTSAKKLNRSTMGDIAIAALLGTAAAGSGNFGSDPRQGQAQFGGVWPPSPEFGMAPRHGFGHPAHMHGYTAGFGGGGYTASFGGQNSAPYPGTMPMMPPGGLDFSNPAHQAMAVQAVAQQTQRAAGTSKRLSLLSPNAGSDVDVEAYVFSLNPTQFGTGSTLNWGTANSWSAARNPQTSFRAERMFINVNSPGVVYVQAIQAANVNAQIGALADAFTFSSYAQGSRVSLPTLPPQNTMQVQGTWTNVTPVPFTPSDAFVLSIDFQGWATVTA